MAKILGEMYNTRRGSLTADFRDKARLNDLHSRLSSLGAAKALPLENERIHSVETSLVRHRHFPLPPSPLKQIDL